MATGEPLELANGVVLPASALNFTFSRAGGPGGQHVNKTSTRATLTVALDELLPRLPEHAQRRLPELAGAYFAGDRLVIHSGDSRSQHANRRSCVEKLRRLVERSMKRPTRRRATKPTKASIQRRIDTKRKRSTIKRQRKSPESE